MLVAMHHSLYVTSFWSADFAQVRNNCFHVDNMKQLFKDIDSIMTFLRQINLFNKIEVLFLKSCFVLHLFQTII